MIQFQGALSSKLPGVGDSIFAVMSKLAKEENAINLSQGFPDFDVPADLIELVNKYMKAGHNQYAPMPGYLPLKEKISDKIEKLYGTKYNPDKEITITAGATQAIYTIISSIIKDGDEVIIFEPAYDSYVPSIILNHGIPKYIKLKLPEYKINWDEVKKVITYNTRMIIINSPHNPSASVLGPDDLKELERIVETRNIIVLSDEVYEHITFDGTMHQSVCKYPNLAQRSFAVFSFGKTYHTTGWKMGYVLAPEKLMAEFRKVFQFLMFTVLTPLQYAYCDYLEKEDHYLGLNAFYEHKRDVFVKGLKKARFKIVPSHGTYFQCLDFSAISDEKDIDFAKRITKEFKIASIPLSVFYHDKTDNKVLRFCFAKSEETLNKASEILCRI
jgi:methionine transaminase